MRNKFNYHCAYSNKLLDLLFGKNQHKSYSVMFFFFSYSNFSCSFRLNSWYCHNCKLTFSSIQLILLKVL